jgi:hypothetical protein
MIVAKDTDEDGSVAVEKEENETST